MLIVAVAIVGAIGFGLAGAFLAEGALHPSQTRTAAETDALLNRISFAQAASCRSLFLQASDGTRLHGYWLARPGATRTVMILHGIGDSSYGSAGYAPFLLRRGFNVLLPDNRGQGQSGGINTFGLDEAGDVVRWSEWLRANTMTTELDGLGESLGGGVLLSSLAKHVPFHAVVAESAYSSFISIADERVTTYLPHGLLMRLAAEGIVEGGVVYTYVRYGKEPGRVSSLKAVAETTVPVNADPRIGRCKNKSGKLEADGTGESQGRLMAGSWRGACGRVRHSASRVRTAGARVVSVKNSRSPQPGF